MTEQHKQPKHVGPVRDDLTTEQLRELGEQLYDQLTELTKPAEQPPPSD